MAESKKSNTVKDENEYLRMKIMLEHGGEVGGMEDVPPIIENIFLKNVIAFEKRCHDAKKIKILEKIGSPNLRPSSEVSDEDLENAWEEMQGMLNSNGIDLLVCSPNIELRDLYRFAAEELIQLEIDDVSIPGMMNCFIYDEFYPDAEYDNKSSAEYEIATFFEKKAFFDHHYAPLVQVNNIVDLPREKLGEVILRFQSLYDEIANVEVEAKDCEIIDKNCIVKGRFSANFSVSGTIIAKQGEWSVGMQLDKNGMWKISTVLIEGIEF